MVKFSLVSNCFFKMLKQTCNCVSDFISQHKKLVYFGLIVGNAYIFGERTATKLVEIVAWIDRFVHILQNHICIFYAAFVRAHSSLIARFGRL